MKLEQLLAVLPEKRIDGNLDIIVRDIVYDSRSVEPNDLFVALKGVHHDGHAYVSEAAKRGAVCVVTERECEIDDVVKVAVPNSRRALALLAAEYYGSPAQELALIGVTGTNGKTTISRLVKSILEADGHTVGLIGTIEYWIGSERIPAGLTTPESLDLQRMLRKMIAQGVMYGVLEVSSHSLTLDRVFGLEFDVAVFSNLSRDHLDFHGSVEEYAQAKSLLFRSLNWAKAKAVINRDDPSGRRMMEVSKAPIISYGFDRECSIWADGVSSMAAESHFTVHTPEYAIPIDLKLLGRFNIYNTLAAIGVGYALHIEPSMIQQGVEQVEGVEGRFERVDCGQPFTVIVDYSHTPDALEHCLCAARELTQRRVIVVFGCGGDRDRGKRPLMGEVADRLADVVVITSDNPRSEDPDRILDEIEDGFRSRSEYEKIADRRAGIERALDVAQDGDCVVIAGKGHETYQIVGQKRIPFSDRAEVEHILRCRNAERFAYDHGEANIR